MQLFLNTIDFAIIKKVLSLFIKKFIKTSVNYEKGLFNGAEKILRSGKGAKTGDIR